MRGEAERDDESLLSLLVLCTPRVARAFELFTPRLARRWSSAPCNELADIPSR